MKKVCVFFCLSLWLLTSFQCFSQTDAGSLPLLIDLNANLTGGNKVNITWTVMQKVNTACFYIERSNDGLSWHFIATVKANSLAPLPCSYTMLDALPEKGINLYRITMKDVNGNVTQSVVKNVRVNMLPSVYIYPNPSANYVNILLGQVAATDWSITIINSLGQTMAQRKYSNNTSTVSLPLANYLPGHYTIEIIQGNSRQSHALMVSR